MQKARDAAPGWDMGYLERSYAEILKGLAKPRRDVEASFLRWLRAFTRGRDPVASGTEIVANAIDKLVLKAATLEEATIMAPGWDAKELERMWRAWVERLGTAPDHPDRAFIGWTQSFTKGKRPA